MMKMMPASRRVVDASLGPPASLALSRVKTPPRWAVAGWLVSMAAKAKSRTNAAGGGDGPVYQRFVKIQLDEGPSLGLMLRMSRNKSLIQIDIELIRPIGADQRQLQRGAVRIDAGGHAVELEREAFYAGRALVGGLGHG